jgi:hydrogenase nickel incorporation protein HypA/HybF
MHELSIVMSILEIADKEIKKAKAEKVDSIELEIGTLSGVEMEAFDFAWEISVKDTVMENAERKIQRTQAKARCADCGHVFNSTTLYDDCPKCGQPFNEILSGRELRVKALTVS